jgi:hypothetical protein
MRAVKHLAGLKTQGRGVNIHNVALLITAGSFMQALVRVGYPYLIDAHHLHPVVWGAVRTLLCSRAQGPWEGLHVAPSLCPSRRAQLCTYFR